MVDGNYQLTRSTPGDVSRRRHVVLEVDETTGCGHFSRLYADAAWHQDASGGEFLSGSSGTESDSSSTTSLPTNESAPKKSRLTENTEASNPDHMDCNAEYEKGEQVQSKKNSSDMANTEDLECESMSEVHDEECTATG